MMAGRRIENLLLLPGSLAGEQAIWQQRANDLAPDAVLVVLPAASGPQRDALECTARSFEAKGWQVTTVVAPSRVALPIQETDLTPHPFQTPTQLTLELSAD